MYLIQVKKSGKLLQHLNTVSPENMLEINLTLVKAKAHGKADIIEIYTHDGLNNTDSIKLHDIIYLEQ